MIDSKLIFDLGAHHGLDTKRYLAEGFKVVALEANPDAAAKMRSQFFTVTGPQHGQAWCSISGLTLVERALHSLDRSTVRLYPSESPEGETHSLFPHRVKQPGIPFKVRTITLGALLSQCGVPWYMKVDIEGSDVVAIRQLHEWAKPQVWIIEGRNQPHIYTDKPLPPYLSVELDWEHPEEAVEMFSLLGYMNYSSFALINQWNPSGPVTVMPNEVTYSMTLMEAIGVWAQDGGYKGWWFDLHARHRDA